MLHELHRTTSKAPQRRHAKHHQLPNNMSPTLASQCLSYLHLHSNDAHPQKLKLLHQDDATGWMMPSIGLSSYQRSHVPSQTASVASDTVTAAHAPAALQPCAGAAGSAWPAVLWVR